MALHQELPWGLHACPLRTPQPSSAPGTSWGGHGTGDSAAETQVLDVPPYAPVLGLQWGHGERTLLPCPRAGHVTERRGLWWVSAQRIWRVTCTKMRISRDLNRLIRESIKGLRQASLPSIRENFMVNDSDPHLTFCVPYNPLDLRIKNKHCHQGNSLLWGLRSPRVAEGPG